MSGRAAFTLGTALAFLAVLTMAAIFAFWPADFARGGPVVTVLFGAGTLARETDLLLLAATFGALGSFLHTAKSFATFAGNRALVASWVWWYCLQPLVGMALAVVIYVVMRGGFLSAGATAADVSPFGVSGIGALSGMFSKQATDKLNEVFSTMFQTGADAERRDKS